MAPSLPDMPFGGAPGQFNTGPDFIFTDPGVVDVQSFGTYRDFASIYASGDSEFSQFIGGGTLAFDIVDWATVGIQTLGNDFSWVLDTEVGLSVEATYTYTPVPAPSALAMLAVVGLLSGKRRR